MSQMFIQELKKQTTESYTITGKPVFAHFDKHEKQKNKKNKKTLLPL